MLILTMKYLSFYKYLKVTWPKWQRTDEGTFIWIHYEYIYFGSYVLKTNKIYRLFLSWIILNIYCLVEFNAFLFLACISRSKANLLVWHPGESPKCWCTCMCNMKNHISFYFLAHLSWKLKWAFLITCLPSSVFVCGGPADFFKQKTAYEM